jgi:hypothetical protein
MSNRDKLEILYDKAEKLTGVRYSVLDAGRDRSDWIAAVEMRFENTVATVYVEPDYDTLLVDLTEMKADSDCYTKLVTSISPWDGLIGRPISWIWLLRNQQGYEDGIRFEFLSREKETPTIITMIGIASTLKIYLSKEIQFIGLR